MGWIVFTVHVHQLSDGDAKDAVSPVSPGHGEQHNAARSYTKDNNNSNNDSSTLHAPSAPHKNYMEWT